MTKATAIYVRVSHRDQKHASQLPDLERWAECHDGDVVWFKDTFTGRTMNRPGMSKLMDALQIGKLDRIVVWRLDRLGRPTRGLCQLFDELRERGVDLVSLKDGFSLESPAVRDEMDNEACVQPRISDLRVAEVERMQAGESFQVFLPCVRDLRVAENKLGESFEVFQPHVGDLGRDAYVLPKWSAVAPAAASEGRQNQGGSVVRLTTCHRPSGRCSSRFA